MSKVKDVKELVLEKLGHVKEESDTRIVIRAIALGGVAGLRSLLAPALLSAKMAHKNPHSAAGRLSEALSDPPVAMTLKVLSAGELIGDKLPQAPSRISPLPLAVRAVSGALVGGAVFGSARRPVWIGVLLGASAAVGAAYGGYHLRKLADEKLNLPDPVIALVEDAIAVGVGTAVLSK